jgi:hypothetical protein
MTVVFDTGSVETWILSTLANNAKNGVNHAFDPYASTTYEGTNHHAGL